MLPEAPTPPQHKTGNAQQCSRRKGLMRHTAASCFPSRIAGGRLPRMGLGLAGRVDASASPARLCCDTRRRVVPRLPPGDACQPIASHNSGKPQAEGTGVQILAFTRGSHSSPTQNGQRATLQTPQGLDATHGGELFPIDVPAAIATGRLGNCVPKDTVPSVNHWVQRATNGAARHEV